MTSNIVSRRAGSFFATVFVAASGWIWQTTALAQDAKALCAAEWPGDYAMQSFCVRRQEEGARGFSAAEAGADAELQAALALCAQEWGPDAAMRNHCAGRHRDAQARLAAGVEGVPRDVRARMLARCAREWGADLAMRAFCVDRQIDGWRALKR